MTTYVAHSNQNNICISITIYKTKLLTNLKHLSEYYLSFNYYNELLFQTQPLTTKEHIFPEQVFPMTNEPNFNENIYPHRITIKAYSKSNLNSNNIIGEITIPIVRVDKDAKYNNQLNAIKQWYYLKNSNEEIVLGILLSIKHIRLNKMSNLFDNNVDNISMCNALHKQIQLRLNELNIKEQYNKYQQINIDSILHAQNAGENYIKQISNYISKQTEEILLNQNIQRNHENILHSKQKHLSFISRRDQILQEINEFDKSVIDDLNFINVLQNKDEIEKHKHNVKKKYKNCKSQFKFHKQISRTSYVNNSIFLNYKLDKTGKSTCLTSNNISLISLHESSIENNKISISQELEKNTFKPKVMQKKKQSIKHLNKSTFGNLCNSKPKIINISLRNKSSNNNVKALNLSKIQKFPK